MPITIEQVIEAISYIEPDAQNRPHFDSDALPYLETLLEAKDTFLASKAAYALSRIQDPQAVKLLKKAAQNDRAEIRIAAAAGVRNLTSPAANDVLLELLDDQDVGVRKFALKSADTLSADILRASPALRSAIQTLSDTDPVPTIRQLAVEVLRRIIPAT